jgi:16S rRNA (cytosine1402-N4)-methyltransferase
LAGILFDLGVSSPQLDEPARGFSFAHDGPLDMRMNRAEGPTAAEWLATVSQQELADVLFRYGEEPRSRQIAAAIVRARATEPLATTRQLANLVAAHAGRQEKRIHPATRTFQAIRIALNDELGALQKGLEQGPSCWTRAGGSS